MAQFHGSARKRANEIQQSVEYRQAELADELALAINRRLLELGESRSELARRLGVSRSAVSQLLAADANPKLSTIARISHALGLDVRLRLAESVSGSVANTDVATEYSARGISEFQNAARIEGFPVDWEATWNSELETTAPDLLARIRSENTAGEQVGGFAWKAHGAALGVQTDAESLECV